MRKIFTLFVAALCCATMFAEDYALPGKFTVNADGLQVQFSLTLIGRAGGGIGFSILSEEQYTNIHLSFVYFAWGTGDDASYTGANTSFVDWGDYLVDYDGNPFAQQFRTLSADEWKYLLSTREHAEYLCGLAKITYGEGDNDYLKGLMLFPDEAYAYADGQYLKFSDDLKFKTYRYNNKFTYSGCSEYTYEQWKQIEAYGAVFLQTGTIYFPDNTNPQFTTVYYWTSTRSSDNIVFAKTLKIDDGDKVAQVLPDVPKNYQLPVRLVKNVQATEGIENIATPADKARKVMMDGTLYIATPDGKIYNANGAEVK